MNKNPERAAQLFKEGYNCSQAVLAAYCDELEMDFESTLKLASSFGGGMGRLREVCGAVSAMFMLAGLKYGYIDPKDNDAKAQHYKLIQDLASRFREKNGSIVCSELLGLDKKFKAETDGQNPTIVPQKRPCAELVRCAAEIVDEVMTKK